MIFLLCCITSLLFIKLTIKESHYCVLLTISETYMISIAHYPTYPWNLIIWLTRYIKAHPGLLYGLPACMYQFGEFIMVNSSWLYPNYVHIIASHVVAPKIPISQCRVGYTHKFIKSPIIIFTNHLSRDTICNYFF